MQNFGLKSTWITRVNTVIACLWTKVKRVKCALVQALRLCTGRTAHRGSRGIAILLLDHGTRWGWGVSTTPRSLFIPRKDPLSIVQEARWTPVSVWTGAQNLAPPEFDPRTVQPLASRYTDCATWFTFERRLSSNSGPYLLHRLHVWRTFQNSTPSCNNINDLVEKLNRK